VYWSAASVIAFLTAGEAMVQYVMIKLSTKWNMKQKERCFEAVKKGGRS
jgi:hypothetical protein